MSVIALCRYSTDRWVTLSRWLDVVVVLYILVRWSEVCEDFDKIFFLLFRGILRGVSRGGSFGDVYIRRWGMGWKPQSSFARLGRRFFAIWYF